MASGAEEWAQMALGVLEKHATGFVMGVASTLFGLFRAHKSGIDPFGWKSKAEKDAAGATAKAEIETAILTERKREAEEDRDEALAELAKLRGGGQG